MPGTKKNSFPSWSPRSRGRSVCHDIPGNAANSRFKPCLCGATDVEHKTRANYKREQMERQFNNQVTTIE